jgi:hypothetical protein
MLRASRIRGNNRFNFSTNFTPFNGIQGLHYGLDVINVWVPFSKQPQYLIKEHSKRKEKLCMSLVLPVLKFQITDTFFQVFTQLKQQQLQTKFTCIVVSCKSPWCWLFKVCSSFSLKSKGRTRAKVKTSWPMRLATSVNTEKQKKVF